MFTRYIFLELYVYIMASGNESTTQPHKRNGYTIAFAKECINVKSACRYKSSNEKSNHYKNLGKSSLAN